MNDNAFFREELCTRCGECFARCRYMNLTRAEAVAEIEKLIRGKKSRVLDQCISCFACDAFCPTNANPYELILSRWNQRYAEKGLPARAEYLLPYREPNYRSDLVRTMDPRERELLDQWQSAPPEGEFLYPGCNLLTLPTLYDLAGLGLPPVAGDWNVCCGEPYFRMGLFPVMELIAKHLTEYYAGKNIKKMVFVCPACLNMFRTILPQKFGAKFDFECEYIADWLNRRIESGEIKVTKPLGRVATVHDSCHARVMGDEIMEGSRTLMKRLGMKLVETRRHHKEGLCCGIAAGCRRYMPHDILSASVKQLREGENTGAPEMMIYCTGCYLMLNMSRHLTRSRLRLNHLLEYVGEATGQTMTRHSEGRTARMLWNVTVKAIPKMAWPARFKVEKVG